MPKIHERRASYRKKARHEQQYSQLMLEYIGTKYPSIANEINEEYNRIAPLYPSKKNLTKTPEWKIWKNRQQRINTSAEVSTQQVQINTNADTSEVQNVAVNEAHINTDEDTSEVQSVAVNEVLITDCWDVYNEDKDVHIETSNEPVEELLMQPTITIPLLNPAEVQRVMEQPNNPIEQTVEGNIPLLDPVEVRRVMEQPNNPFEQAVEGLNIDDILNLNNIDDIVDNIIRELEGRSDEGVVLDYEQDNIFW